MKLGKHQQTDCVIAFVEVTVSNMMLADSVAGKFINRLWTLPEEEMRSFVEKNGAGISDTATYGTMEEAMASLLSGNAVFFMDGFDRAVKIAGRGYPNMGVTKAESEKVLRGSREGFTDSVKLNTALIRKRVRSTGLKVEEMQTGVRSDTLVALVYMEELVIRGFWRRSESGSMPGRSTGFWILVCWSSWRRRTGSLRFRSLKRRNGRIGQLWRR